jgi:hypothetical protein
MSGHAPNHDHAERAADKPVDRRTLEERALNARRLFELNNFTVEHVDDRTFLIHGKSARDYKFEVGTGSWRHPDGSLGGYTTGTLIATIKAADAKAADSA